MNLSQLFRSMIQEIGENPERPGLKETPERAAKAWREMTVGYSQKPEQVFKVFPEPTQFSEIIVVSNIPFASTCEHHLLPFMGVVHCGYIPLYVDRFSHIAGLSKFPRLVDVFAKRLQVQERLTEEIINSMDKILQPIGCGVVIEAEHLCMACRGVKRAGVRTITSSLRGCFKEAAPRQEFFSLIRSSK